MNLLVDHIAGLQHLEEQIWNLQPAQLEPLLHLEKYNKQTQQTQETYLDMQDWGESTNKNVKLKWEFKKNEKKPKIPSEDALGMQRLSFKK